MSTDGTRALRVAIIGAGMTGLLIAQGLQKIGYDVVLYERDASLHQRDLDWTMSIHWSLSNLEQILPSALLADMHLAYTDRWRAYDDTSPPPGIPFYNGRTGEVLHRVPAANVRRVARSRFRGLCARGLDIRWGKKLVDMTFDAAAEGPVTLHFDGDTEAAEADLVIGADGPHSQVRRLLLGEEAGRATPSGWGAYNGIVHYGDADKARFVRAAHPLCSMAYTDHGLIFCGVHTVPDPQDASSWSFHILRFFRQQQQQQHQLALTQLYGPSATEGLKSLGPVSEHFHSAISWIPSAQYGEIKSSGSSSGSSNFHTTQLHTWSTVPWPSHDGRVTLAGDAAHSMLPSRGQGLNHALEDAARLVAHLERVKTSGVGGRKDITAALAEYQTEVCARGRKAVEGSLEDAEDNTRVGSGRDEGKQGARLTTQGLEK